MQVRPHPEDRSTKRVWLSHEDRKRLLEVHRDYPMRQTALRLGLHGLRSVEIMGVAKDHFRQLDGSDTVFKLYVPEDELSTYDLESGEVFHLSLDKLAKQRG